MGSPALAALPDARLLSAQQTPEVPSAGFVYPGPKCGSGFSASQSGCLD
jgi:hypothetical protein